MTTVINQPNLVEGLTLLGWRLKRDAEIRERKNDPNFECEVEPTSTSYAALENISSKDDDYNPYAGLNIDLCLEVDAIDLNSGNQPVNDDYDPYEVFMKMNTRRTVTGRDRAPLAVLPSHAGSSSALVNNYRNYNFAEDDTPVKYPLAIGHVDRRVKQPPVRGGFTARPSFEEERRARGGMATRPIVQSTSSSTSTSTSYRSNPGIIPRRGVPASLVPTRGNSNQMRRNIPPPPRLYPRSEYPPSASSKRVTFRQSNDYNSGDDFEEEEEDDDSLEGDLHQPMTRRTKLPRRTAARIAVQRFRSNNIRSALADDDLDDDIAPTVTEMDMLEDQDLDEEESNVQTITKSMSSPVKLPPPPPPLPPTKSTGGSSKSSYIGNMLPSFYEQLPESKKMLLQDATIDSSSNNTLSSTNSTTNAEDSGKTSIEMASPGKKQAGLTTEQIQGPGGEEIIDEENRLQFRNTTISQPYKRSTNNNYQNSKRYYDNEEDDDQQQGRKRARVNDDDYGSSGGNQRQSQYSKQNRYRKYEDDDEYDINQDAQQQEEEFQQTIRLPARRGRPPSQHHQQQEDPKEKYARIKAQFEEQHGLVLGEMRVFAPKLRLRISSVNVNWINLPPIPKLPHKVHQS